jgi:hypothetical protein
MAAREIAPVIFFQGIERGQHITRNPGDDAVPGRPPKETVVATEHLTRPIHPLQRNAAGVGADVEMAGAASPGAVKVVEEAPPAAVVPAADAEPIPTPEVTTLKETATKATPAKT